MKKRSVAKRRMKYKTTKKNTPKRRYAKPIIEFRPRRELGKISSVSSDKTIYGNMHKQRVS
jgi:hypothetical protein